MPGDAGQRPAQSAQWGRSPALFILSTSSPRYFIALLPPAPLAAAIVARQQQMADLYQSRKALNSPPHLTLQPPFTRPAAEQESLVVSLAAFARGRSPFPVQLDGFGAFPPRVIFLQPLPSLALLELHRDLQAHCAQTWDLPPSPRPFRPHITLAFRDLTPTAFQRAWSDLAERPLTAEWLATALALLRHDGQRWQVAAQLPLGSDRN